MILTGISAALILLAVSQMWALNRKKEKRWKQSYFLWSQLIGDLLCIACVQFFAAVRLPQWLALPPFSWRTSVGLDLLEVLASNAASGLALLACKAVSRTVGSMLKKNRPPRWARRWYRQDSKGIHPTEAAAKTRKWALLALWMSILGLAVGAAIRAFTPALVPLQAFRWWPMLQVSALLEVYWFMGGKTDKAEQAQKEKGDNLPAAEEADYEKTFSEWFVCKQQLFPLDEEDKRDEESQEAEILSCMQQVAEHSHVLVEAVLYSQLGEALIVYLDSLMEKNENVLVLALDSLEAERGADYIRRAMERRRGTGKKRIIRSPRDIQLNGDCDLAVLTAQQMLELRLGVYEHPFTKNLNNLVVLDTAQILSWQSDLLATVIRLLINHCPLKHTIFLSGAIPLQLATVLNGILGVPNENLKVVGTELKERPHTVYLWKKENAVNRLRPLSKLTSINVQAHDFDLTAPLAVKACRLDRVPIRVISECFPVRQIVQAVQLSAAVFSKIVPVDQLIEDLQDEDDRPMTVLLEDQDCMLAAALNLGRKHAADHGDVHLISRPYMLRDYFMAGFRQEPVNFIRERTYANPLSNSFSDSAYTVAIRIMIEAATRDGIPETQLRKLVNPYVSGGSLRDLLCWCGRQVFRKQDYDTPENDFRTEEGDYFTQEGQFEHMTWIRIQNPAVLDDLQHSRLKRAKLSIPSSSRLVNLRFSADSIRQRLLVSQGLMYDGTIYRVTHIDEEEGLIKAELATEDMRDATDFIQTRSYDLAHSALIPDGSTIDQVDRIMVHSYLCESVQVKIPGYYMLPQDASAPRLLKDGAMIYQRLAQPESRTLTSTHITLLGLRWRVKSDPSAASVFLAILMNELFRTYFPSDWPCIAACPLLPAESGKEIQTQWKKLSSYYPSVNLNALPDVEPRPDYAYIVLLEDCGHSDGRLLQALLASVQRPFEMPLTVLADYLSWLETEPIQPTTYLAFGSDHIPACFDISGMKEILKQLYSY